VSVFHFTDGGDDVPRRITADTPATSTLPHSSRPPLNAPDSPFSITGSTEPCKECFVTNSHQPNLEGWHGI